MNFGKADSVVALDFNWSKLKTVNRAAPRVYEIFTKRSSSFFETDQDFNSIYLLGPISSNNPPANPNLLVHYSCKFFPPVA